MIFVGSSSAYRFANCPWEIADMGGTSIRSEPMLLQITVQARDIQECAGWA